MTRAAGLAAGAVLFIWFATANSGGYRYGVSDQAFYSAAVIKALNPAWFPRDAPLLEAQSHLMWADEIVAGLSHRLGLDLPQLYFGLYLLTLLVLCAAAYAFGRAAKFSTWTLTLLVAFLTFKHRIAKTGANSLEGYMHPRMLAFGLGLASLAAAMRGRFAWALAALGAAAVWHPTTAVWFGIVVATAMAVADRRWRPWVLGAAGLVGVIGAGTWMRGGLADRLTAMDPAWLAVLAEKDYLFPTEWPIYAWFANLAYVAVIVLVYRRRRALAALAPAEHAVVAGLLTLFGAFLVSVPFTAWRIALAVQSQATRAFWVLDFVTVAYLAWWLMTEVARSTRARATICALVVAASASRGVFLLTSAHSDRDLVRIGFPESPWMEAMTWLRQQPSGWHVLADPGHAWKYGVSVRLAAEKDTVLETGKDSALAMYDRRIAMRVADRSAALTAYPHPTLDELRALDSHYDLDVAVVDVGAPRYPLPELFRNAQFVVYDLR